MCSSGLEALPYPLSTKFFRSTDLRFTTLPAIATYTLLCPGVLVVRVLAFLKFLEGKEVFIFFFSGWDRHTLWQALVCVLVCEACQCV